MEAKCNQEVPMIATCVEFICAESVFRAGGTTPSSCDWKSYWLAPRNYFEKTESAQALAVSK